MKLPIMNKGVTLTEIPNKVAVFFEVGNCTVHCSGCHSPTLWIEEGAEWMTLQDLMEYANSQLVDTVVFMGGFTNGIAPELVYRLIIEPMTEHFDVGVYHGGESLGFHADKLKYLKLGKYDKTKGGLDSPTTNQRFYVRADNGSIEDKTYLFRKGNT